jgi:hypothetical protein
VWTAGHDDIVDNNDNNNNGTLRVMWLRNHAKERTMVDPCGRLPRRILSSLDVSPRQTGVADSHR